MKALPQEEIPSTSYVGEKYTVSRLNHESRLYQGHYPASLEGFFEEAQIDMPAGSWYVNMAQPMAYLIFYLLEPEANDGLVYWNYFDDYLEERGVGNNQVRFPAFKVMQSSSSIDEDSETGLLLSFNQDMGTVSLSGLSVSAGNKVVELLSVKGQILEYRKIPQGDSYYSFAVNNLARGIYFIRYSEDQKSSMKRIFVSHGE